MSLQLRSGVEGGQQRAGVGAVASCGEGDVLMKSPADAPDVPSAKPLRWDAELPGLGRAEDAAVQLRRQGSGSLQKTTLPVPRKTCRGYPQLRDSSGVLALLTGKFRS